LAQENFSFVTMISGSVEVYKLPITDIAKIKFQTLESLKFTENEKMRQNRKNKREQDAKNKPKDPLASLSLGELMKKIAIDFPLGSHQVK
jgi:hypothetical protein